MRLWLGTLRQWHWISSALCLVGMLLFSVTGITLNHAGQIESKPQVQSRAAQLPESLLTKLQTETPESGLPVELRAWLEQTLDIRLAGREAEWSDGELYVALPRPGGDAWLSLSSETGELEYESTDRGWIAYFNDLHKGRHTGEAWSWFIDFFAVACVVFSLRPAAPATSRRQPAQHLAAGRPGAGDTAAAGAALHSLRTAHA